MSAREALCALLWRRVERGYPGRKTRGVRGRFRGIFARTQPFENGTMIKGGTPKGAPPTHKAPQRGPFSAFGQGTHSKKLKILGEPRAAQRPCFKRFGGSPIFRRGDDGNKHRKRKTHSAGACSSTKSAAKNYRRGRLRLVIVRTITMIPQIIRRWSNKKETASHPSPWVQLGCPAFTIARQ